MSENESNTPETEADEAASEAIAPEESSGDAHLDKILEEGVLKGQARPELAQLLMAAFMVFALGWLAYTSTLRADFFVEDELAIVQNENLHRIPTISRGWGDGISPIAALTFAIDWTLGGGSPVPFRVTQLLLHLACAVLVFLLCREVSKKHGSEAAAMAGGLWFALVPTGVVTVTLLSERDTILELFFLLLGGLLMLRATKGDQLDLVKFVLAFCAGGLAIVCGMGPVAVGMLLSGAFGKAKLLPRLIVLNAFILLLFLPGTHWEYSIFDIRSTIMIYYLFGLIGAIVIAFTLSLVPVSRLRTGLGAGVAAFLVAFALMTNMQASERQDEEFYWTQQADKAPEAFEPKLRLAMVYERMTAQLEEEIAQDPMAGNARGELDRRIRMASGYYGDARRIEPNLRGRLSNYAHALKKFGETAQAIDVMRDAIAVEPQNAELIRTIALWHADVFAETNNVQRLRTALDYYDALDDLDAATERDRFARADSFMKLGLAKEAADQLRLIKDQDVLRDAQPLIKAVQPRMTRMQQHQKEFTEAAQGNRPIEELLRPRLAQLIAEGFILRARYTAEELVRATGGTNAEDWIQLAALYAGTGNLEGLNQHWPPPETMTDPWDALARELVQQKNYNAAFAVLETQGERAEALESLAAIARERNDMQEAVALYQRAAQEFPDRKIAWLALAEIAIEQNQIGNLAEILKRAEAAGASTEEIETLKTRAGLEGAQQVQLQPSIIR